jgi:hypothetical protein
MTVGGLLEIHAPSEVVDGVKRLDAQLEYALIISNKTHVLILSA